MADPDDLIARDLIASDRIASDLLARDGEVSRRMALRALAAMGVAAPVIVPALAESSSDTGSVLTLQRAGAKPAGSATDPDLRRPVVPWPRTLSAAQLRNLAALCDLILPADERSPSASALGCHEFVDEWVSAPYPEQQQHRQLVLEGLEWLAAEGQRRFSKAEFVALSGQQQAEICDDICAAQPKVPELAMPGRFFTLIRNLTCGAFFTTETGMQDIGYVGNQPLPSWKAPPEVVLRHLGLHEKPPV